MMFTWSGYFACITGAEISKKFWRPLLVYCVVMPIILFHTPELLAGHGLLLRPRWVWLAGSIGETPKPAPDEKTQLALRSDCEGVSAVMAMLTIATDLCLPYGPFIRVGFGPNSRFDATYAATEW